MRALPHRTVRLLLLLWLLGSITITLQAYVGHATLYAPELRGQREALHRAILRNEAPGGGSWHAAGAQGINLRVGAVYLAEAVRRASGLDVATVYLLLDTAFLYAVLLGLFLHLRRWLPDAYCLLGVLYFCCVLPLTYFLHHFHPYDRLQLAIWLLLLHLVRERRVLPLGAVLAVGVAVKYDALALPAFYFLCHAGGTDRRRVAVETAGLCAVAFGVYLALVLALPAPQDPSRLGLPMLRWALAQNLADLRAKNVAFPPLLGHALPLALAFAGLRGRDRFLRASVWFACLLAPVYFFFSLVQEIRTQLVVLVLVMPAALLTARRLLEGGPACRAAPAGPPSSGA